MHVQDGSGFDGGIVGGGGVVERLHRYLKWNLDSCWRLNRRLRNGRVRGVGSGFLWAAWGRRGSCFFGAVGAVAASCIAERSGILTVVSEGRAPSWRVMVSRDMVVGMDSPGDVAVVEGMASSLEVACWRILGHCCMGVVVVEAVVGCMSDCPKVHVHPLYPGSIHVMPSLCVYRLVARCVGTL